MNVMILYVMEGKPKMGGAGDGGAMNLGCRGAETPSTKPGYRMESSLNRQVELLFGEEARLRLN